MAIRACPNCQANVDDSQLFCPECGTRLSNAPAAAEGATQVIQRPDIGSQPSYPPQGQQPYGGQPTYPPQNQQPYGGQPSYPPPGQQSYGGYPTPAPKAKSSAPLIIGILVAVLLLGGGGAFFALNGKDDPEKTTVSLAATARPKPTARPTSEPTDEPEPTEDIGIGGVPFLEDDFTTKDEGWPEGETNSKSGRYDYVEDGYQITVAISERILWTSTSEFYDDVDAQIDVTVVEGPTENAAGLIIREQSDGSLYAFQLDANGEYALRRFDKANEEWTNLIEWDFASSANTGLGQTNRLRVVAVGPVFTLSINGEEVNTVVDDTYTSGSIGFGSSTFEEGGSVFRFNNLLFSYP